MPLFSPWVILPASNISYFEAAKQKKSWKYLPPSPPSCGSACCECWSQLWTQLPGHLPSDNPWALFYIQDTWSSITNQILVFMVCHFCSLLPAFHILNNTTIQFKLEKIPIERESELTFSLSPDDLGTSSIMKIEGKFVNPVQVNKHRIDFQVRAVDSPSGCVLCLRCGRPDAF